MSNISAITDAEFDDLAAGVAPWGLEIDADGLDHGWRLHTHGGCLRMSDTVHESKASADAVFADLPGGHRPAHAVLQVAGLPQGFKVAADAISCQVVGR